MARAYGNDRSATIALRVSEQEKAQIKAAAANLGKSVGEYIREAVAAFMIKEVKQ